MLSKSNSEIHSYINELHVIFVCWLKFRPKEVLLLLIAINKVIGNIIQIKTVSVTLVNVQEHQVV